MSDTQIKQILSSLLQPQRVADQAPFFVPQQTSPTTHVPFNEKFLTRQRTDAHSSQNQTHAEKRISSSENGPQHVHKSERVERSEPSRSTSPSTESHNQGSTDRISENDRERNGINATADEHAPQTQSVNTHSSGEPIQENIDQVAEVEDTIPASDLISEETNQTVNTETIQSDVNQTIPAGLSEFLSIQPVETEADLEGNETLPANYPKQNAEGEAPSGLATILSSESNNLSASKEFIVLQQEAEKLFSGAVKEPQTVTTEEATPVIPVPLTGRSDNQSTENPDLSNVIQTLSEQLVDDSEGDSVSPAAIVPTIPTAGVSNSDGNSEVIQLQPIPTVVSQTPQDSNAENDGQLEQPVVQQTQNHEQIAGNHSTLGTAEFLQQGTVTQTTVIPNVTHEKFLATQGSDQQQAAPVSSLTQVGSAVTSSISPQTSFVTTLSSTTSTQMISIDDPEFPARLGHLLQQAETTGKSIRIRLNPPELGTMQIEVIRQSGQVVARLETESAITQSLLTEQLGMLKESLESQGLKVDRFEVEVSEDLKNDQFSEAEKQEDQSDAGDSSTSSGHDSDQGSEEHSIANQANIVTEDNLDITV